MRAFGRVALDLDQADGAPHFDIQRDTRLAVQVVDISGAAALQAINLNRSQRAPHSHSNAHILW